MLPLFKTETQAAPYEHENTPDNPWVNVPVNTTTDNIDNVLNGDVVAWNEVTVTGGTVITEANIDEIRELLPKILTTNTISIDHDANPNTPNIDVTVDKLSSPELQPGDIVDEELILTSPPDCGEDVLPLDAAYLQQLCSDPSRYSPVALLRVPTEDSSNEQPDEVGFGISPNPAETFLKVNVKLLNADKVTLRVYNMMGQLIDAPITDASYPSGTSEIYIPLENYPPSTYLIEFQTSDDHGVEKFVKQ